MQDITYCLTQNCPLDDCRRKDVPKDKKWTSMCKFTYKKGKCKQYWPAVRKP